MLWMNRLGLALPINNAPSRRYEFRYEPFAAAAMTPGHIGPSQFAAVDAGNQSDFWPG